MSEFGSILPSPPYEGALNASKHVGGIAARDPQLAKTGLYSKDRNNIGNMIGQTYLGEMLKVYRECYRVLKPGKFLIVVVKDIQRNSKTQGCSESLSTLADIGRPQWSITRPKTFYTL